MPEMIRNEFQHMKQFNVPQGGYYAMVVNTARKGVAGDLKIEMSALPLESRSKEAWWQRVFPNILFSSRPHPMLRGRWAVQSGRENHRGGQSCFQQICPDTGSYPRATEWRSLLHPEF